MTFRAITLALLAGLFVAGLGYVNDGIMKLTYLVGNHLPISVFGLLVLVVVVNPMLSRLRPSWRFKPAELVFVVTMMLAACSIPGSGLMRTLTPAITMPIEINQTSPGWQDAEVLSYVPPRMMPAGAKFDPQVMNDYLQGARSRQGGFPLWEVFGDKVPWAKWAAPLETWIPLALLMSLGAICLSLIVHHQWTLGERLRYPIADLALSLTGRHGGGALAPIFRRRLLWVGLLVVLTIRVVNGIHAWYPGSLQIPLSFDFLAIGRKYPSLLRARFGLELLGVTLYPTVVAFAFFLASDVSFSLGISQILAFPIVALLLTAGVEVWSDRMTGGPAAWQKFGSSLGLGILLAYTGRRYYWNVLKQAFTFVAREGVEPYAAWACRIFVVCVVAMTAMLAWLGLDWPLALLTVLMIMLLFVVAARLNAEGGLFFFQPSWVPLGVLMGLFGAAALGPRALAIAGLVCAVLVIDPRECLMPFVINGLKMCQEVHLRPAKVGIGVAAMCALGLAVAVPVVLWSNYNHGVPRWDMWATNWVPSMTFRTVESTVTQLKLSDELDKSEGLSAWQRLKGMWRPHEGMTQFLLSTGLGLVMVGGFSVLRLRFTWWPLHPIIFLVWYTYPMACFSHSFLLGWLIKMLVTRLGGAQAFRKGRALMIGVIAGDLLGGLVFMVVGAIYYAVMGSPGEVYRIFP